MGVLDDIKTGVEIAGDIFGLSGSADCDDQILNMERQILEYLTPGDMTDLVRGTDSNVAPDAQSMALFYAGGRDCKHKNVGSGDQQFLDELPRRIAQRKSATATGSPSPSLSTPTPFQGPGFPTWMYGVGAFLLLIIGWLLTQGKPVLSK